VRHRQHHLSKSRRSNAKISRTSRGLFDLGFLRTHLQLPSCDHFLRSPPIAEGHLSAIRNHELVPDATLLQHLRFLCANLEFLLSTATTFHLLQVRCIILTSVCVGPCGGSGFDRILYTSITDQTTESSPYGRPPDYGGFPSAPPGIGKLHLVSGLYGTLIAVSYSPSPWDGCSRHSCSSRVTTKQCATARSTRRVSTQFPTSREHA